MRTPPCTRNHVALVITPDGVRRPVAVSILTLMLALTGRLLVKNRITRDPARFGDRAQHMGVGHVGHVGRRLGSIGIGNIGAEMFRLARPLDMRFIAHAPYADPAVAAGLEIELVDLDEAFRRTDVLAVSCALSM